MPRGLIFAVVLVSSAYGGVWPQKLGNYQLKSAAPVTPAAYQAQAAEYGFESGERADYGSFSVTALRFKDVTGAYAASLDVFNEVEPSAVRATLRGFLRVGNYLVNCSGECPRNLAKLADAGLPGISHGALPTLGTYFPAKSLVPRSERYIMGPEGLKADAPDILPSAVGFDFGTEGEVAHYRTPAGPVTLAIFSFPLPSMARQQLPEFQKIAGATVKRTGPLVAVAFGPGPSAAKLLNDINYQGVVAENEKPPEKPLELKPESAGKMVLAILSLAGLLLAFCLLSGLAVGGTLRLARRFGYSAAEGSMTTLHLEGK